MKGKLALIAGDHNLDETVYVRWTEQEPDENGNDLVSEACDTLEKILDDGEESTVVGVYTLVGIEEVRRVRTVSTRKLA